MPRTARLDAPGVVQHVMIRGIERRSIFLNNEDREDFLQRLETLLPETKTICYAWAFIPNHAHFLFRSGTHGLATLMRRLLTGYVVAFNELTAEVIFSNRRGKWVVEARSLICYFAVREMGISLTWLAKEWGASLAAVSYAAVRGEKTAKAKKYRIRNLVT